MATYDLNTTVRGTPAYTSGGAKFGSYGLSGGVIKATDGVDNFLSSTGNDGGTLNGTGTIEAWVKSSSSSGRKVFLQHSGWWYLCSDGSTLGLEWGYTGSPPFISGGNITDGAWHHVAVVFNAGQPSIYVDGSRVNTSTTVTTATGDGTGVKSFAVGGFVPASGFDWPGSIDEVRVSNVARYSGTTYTVPTSRFAANKNTAALYRLEGSGANTPAGTVTVKSQESGSWVSRTALSKARVGGAWQVGHPKRWNGSAWIDMA